MLYNEHVVYSTETASTRSCFTYCYCIAEFNSGEDNPYIELSAPTNEHTYDRPDAVHYDKVKYENTKKLVGGGESSQESIEPAYERVS